MESSDILFESVEQFVRYIKKLRKKRRKTIVKNRDSRLPRKSPSIVNRNLLLEKTGGRCHVCGGLIKSTDKWQADHISAYAHGGKDSIDNYLPAHTKCNNYRRSFTAEEFRLILKLGVWFRTKIEKENDIALHMTEKFLEHEAKRDSRRIKR